MSSMMRTPDAAQQTLLQFSKSNPQQAALLQRHLVSHLGPRRSAEMFGMQFPTAAPMFPKLPTVPTIKANAPDISKAVQSQRRRFAQMQGREQTVLGGTTGLAEPFVKTLLGS